MTEKTCCVAGPCHIPADKKAFVLAWLRDEISAAIADGYTTFISGFLQGVDLYFADLVLEQKALHPYLVLEAALSYRGRTKGKRGRFKELLLACDHVSVQQDSYGWNSYLTRNQHMVLRCSRIIAVHGDFEKGSYIHLIQCAQKEGLEIRSVQLCV